MANKFWDNMEVPACNLSMFGIREEEIVTTSEVKTSNALDESIDWRSIVRSAISADNTNKIITNQIAITMNGASNVYNKENNQGRNHQWNIVSSIGQQERKEFNVCQYDTKYKSKRERKIKEQLEREKKAREFHSKPAPNFRAIHAKREKKHKSEENLIQKVTLPETPMVVKRHREGREKRKQRLEQILKESESKPFKSRPATVTQDSPFRPKPCEMNHIETKPFNLHVERRLEQRRQWDEEFNKKMEHLKLQEEEEKRISDEKLVKEIRKKATFKANPIPYNK